jgi:GNAT superfamily N-acetyltransferase
MSTFSIRQANVEDASIITQHRRAMFEDMGRTDYDRLDDMARRFEPWVRESLAQGDYLGWFVVNEAGEVVAGAGLWLMAWLPHVLDDADRRGNVVNVYTRPDYRRQGLARRLMGVVLDWCREHHVSTVILHASSEGRPLYESLGFKASNEMRIQLGP